MVTVVLVRKSPRVLVQALSGLSWGLEPCSDVDLVFATVLNRLYDYCSACIFLF